MSAAANFVKRELQELIPPVLFFLVAFHILALFRALMLRQYGLSVSAVAGATIGALIVGKVVLIADSIPFFNRFPTKPLIYNIVWKTLVYMIGATVVHYLERLIPIWIDKGSLGAANTELFEKIVWAHTLALQLWLVILFFMYCTIRELARALGPEKMRRIFLGGGEVGGAAATT